MIFANKLKGISSTLSPALTIAVKMSLWSFDLVAMALRYNHFKIIHY